MIRIKLKNTEGKIKYITKRDEFPIEVGETLRMKWKKEWIVISINKIKK